MNLHHKEMVFTLQIERINMHDYKPTCTPMELGLHLLVCGCPTYMDKKK